MSSPVQVKIQEPRPKAVTASGLVQWDDANTPVRKAIIEISSLGGKGSLGRTESNEQGRFDLELTEDCCDEEILVHVRDHEGRGLTSVQTRILPAAKSLVVNLSVPAGNRREAGDQARAGIQAGPLRLDARAFEKAEPEIVMDIARAMVDPAFGKKAERRIAALSPELVPEKHLRRTLCGTRLLQTLDAIIAKKHWPRETALAVDDILRMRNFGYTQTSYDCPNFTINYYIDGPSAPNADTSSQTVVDPGLGTVLATLPAGGPPTYIKRCCFWLERALNTYITPPFSLRNPAGGGKIQVYINTSPYGSATPGAFYLNNALNNDLIAAVTVHELFHMVQFQYGGSGAWQYSMMEGGAVWAEDANTEMMNRYADEAGSNFNGIGVQNQPQMSLESAGYKCSLFWRYLSEQRSVVPTDADEPLPIALTNFGGDVYKPLIEKCEASGWSRDSVKAAIRSMPYYGDFYEFGYLDAARQDLTSSETTLGNYVLACYLKELDESAPDRRFDFMEGQETIYMDEVIPETPEPGDKLPPVHVEASGTLNPSSSVVFNSSVPTFGSRYFEVNIGAGVSSVNVNLNAGAVSGGIFQIVTLDQTNAVREIYRTDKMSYTKQFANQAGGNRLSKIVAVLTGTAGSGNFTITVSAAATAPDVMVTRWNSAASREYEIDSRHWSWTWVSPDIWVDNDGDGLADGDVFFNYNNRLTIRLHNKGNADASGISVQFWYQDASGGLSSAGWLPVQDTSGTTQSLNGLSLAAGATNTWAVNWSPVPSGASHHFCIRAVVTVPGDPNADNKRVLSNFGNVHVRFGGRIDLTILRRAVRDIGGPVELQVVPRLSAGLQVSLRDVLAQRVKTLDPGEVSRDMVSISHTPTKTVAHVEPEMHNKRGCEFPRLEFKPDPSGHYPTDHAALPPGFGRHPLVTLTHLQDGVAIGGVTFMVTVDREQ